METPNNVPTPERSTGIAWTHHTWNPWSGCRKVSPGCKYCYMYREKERYHKDPTVVVRSVDRTFRKPLLGGKNGLKGKTGLVFTCSFSDFFIEEADAWRAEAWAIIKATPNLTYQILTKRPERVLRCLPDDWGPEGYPNVWLGVTIEGQKEAEERLPILRDWKAPVRFVSFEPLLEYVSPIKALDRPGFLFDVPFEWAIIGGESGNDTGKYRYRELHIEYIDLLVYEIQQRMKVPVFVKQLGTHIAKQHQLAHRHGADATEWPAKTGYRPDQLPQDFPEVYQPQQSQRVMRLHCPSVSVTGRSNKVYLDGNLLDPTPSLKLRNHSPTGFAWGYSGSGPAQLALAVLLEVLPENEALARYQDFKREVIAQLEGDQPFDITFEVGAKTFTFQSL